MLNLPCIHVFTENPGLTLDSLWTQGGLTVKKGHNKFPFGV